MDFAQRGQSQNQSAGPAPSAGVGASAGRSSKKADGPKWVRWSMGILLIAVSFVLFGALMLLVVNSNDKGESKFLDTGKYQAVFLNGGQVYFGQIKSLNSQFLRVRDIYYLRVNQTVQPNQANNQATNDVSLVKLGCELHGPQDEMVINREQVIFWENLKSDGQVAKAVEEYKKQNPNGQQCNTNTQQTNTNQ